MAGGTPVPLWAKLVILGMSAVGIGIAIAGGIYYNRLRQGGSLKQGESNTMFYISIGFAVLAIVVFLYTLYTLLFAKDVRTSIETKVTGYLNSPSTGAFGGKTPIIQQAGNIPPGAKR